MTTTSANIGTSAPPARPPNVLLLGGILTLTARVARCLDRAGMRPVILGTDQIRPLALLPECKRYIPWTGVRWVNGELFNASEGFAAACHEHHIDVVIPADLDTSLFLSRQTDLPPGVRIGPLAPADRLIDLHNKWSLAQRMQRIGVRHPDSVLARDLHELLEHGLSYPILTKPLDASDGVGIQRHQSADDLAAFSKAATSVRWPLLVQEFVQGIDVDMSFMAVDGKVVAHSIFEHGGRSRRFFEDDRVRASVEKIVADAQYSGVGHVDTRYDPERDDFFVLEINPRFWGSLLYEAYAGVNYPALYVQHALSQREGEVPRTTPGHVRLPLRDATICRLLGQMQKVYAFKYRLHG
jgi:hypothetical protein